MTATVEHDGETWRIEPGLYRTEAEDACRDCGGLDWQAIVGGAAGISRLLRCAACGHVRRFLWKRLTFVRAA